MAWSFWQFLWMVANIHVIVATWTEMSVEASRGSLMAKLASPCPFCEERVIEELLEVCNAIVQAFEMSGVRAAIAKWEEMK